MEEYIKKESVFTTYCNTSVSQNDSDSDEESSSYAPLGSFTATSANLAVTDLIILGFL